MRKEFEGIVHRKVDVITNGFDEEDIYTGSLEMDTKFSLSHIGTLVKSRNPLTLWVVLQKLVAEHPGFAADLEIKLVGKVDRVVTESLTEKGLHQFVKKIDYLNHPDVIKVQQQSQILLLLLNDTPNAKGILTGKFFEYLAAGRPVLCIGPTDGDVAEIINQTTCGSTVDFQDQSNMEKRILHYYSLFKSGTLMNTSKSIDHYGRKALTGQLAMLLNSITEK